MGSGVDVGNRSIRIESVRQDDIGVWTRTLLSDEGRVFKGEVKVDDESKSVTLCVGDSLRSCGITRMEPFPVIFWRSTLLFKSDGKIYGAIAARNFRIILKMTNFSRPLF